MKKRIPTPANRSATIAFRRTMFDTVVNWRVLIWIAKMRLHTVTVKMPTVRLRITRAGQRFSADESLKVKLKGGPIVNSSRK